MSDGAFLNCCSIHKLMNYVFNIMKLIVTIYIHGNLDL